MINYRIDNKELTELQPEIENWKKENSEIIMIQLADDPFDGIFKVPTTDHLKIAEATTGANMDKNTALCLQCILYPEPQEFSKILEQRSGIVVPIADKLVDAAGVTQQVTIKKL